MVVEIKGIKIFYENVVSYVVIFVLSCMIYGLYFKVYI